MTKPKLYTRRRVVDITPAGGRQIERLAALHERTIPDLIRQAIANTSDLQNLTNSRQP